VESDRMVIFSGWPDLHYEGVRYNDTWTYDYNSNTWTNMSPSSMPVGRGAHMMAYNQRADVTVMFGGVAGWQADDEKILTDTWTYDVNTNTWTNMSPASNPTPRVAAAMAYDNESDIIVMFGGWLPDWSASDETWIYNLTSNTWTNVTTGSQPEARFYGNLVYDYKNSRLLLVGGTNWDGLLHDIWEYNYGSNIWTEILATNEAPVPAVGMTYDSESELIVAYGGPIDLSEAVFVTETWTFNLTSRQWNNTWSQNNPRERSRQYLAYDIESDRTIMYGGALPSGQQGEAIGDTWAYDYRVNEPLLIPPPPEDLDVSPDSTSLIVTWNPPAESEGFTITGYNVYRGTEPGVFELYAELGNVLSFTDLRVGFDITYYYVTTTVATTGESEEFSNSDSGFLDLDPYDDGVYTFIAYGDTRASTGGGVSPIHDDLVSRYLQLSDPEMIIHTGDLVNQGGDAVNWPLYDDSVSATQTWDSNLEIYYAVGNHEQYSGTGPSDVDFSTYRDYVDFSDVVNEIEGETELYYSFDWQNIHFIFLNSIDGWVGEDFICPTAQWDWLVSDFERNDKECIIVSMHNPSYSIRADRPDRWTQAAAIRAEFHDLFVDNDVDIVFSGHDHQYYHTYRDGIEYVVSGGGGAPLYEIDTEAPDWEPGDIAFSDYHYCVCKITRVNSTHSRLSVDVVVMDGTTPDVFYLDFSDPIPEPTTPTTPTTTVPDGFPMVMTLVILGGVVAVIVIIVLIVRQRR
ncbi:MAG: Kelch repeat-containing protein, partial [Candidatus Thorarchaeota archaeon SMTZ1-45]